MGLCSPIPIGERGRRARVGPLLTPSRILPFPLREAAEARRAVPGVGMGEVFAADARPKA